MEMMAETCFLAESAICYPPLFNELRALVSRPTTTSETVAISAVAAALEQNAGAILVMSTSGNTARLVSKYRPPCPVITSQSFFPPLHFPSPLDLPFFSFFFFFFVLRS